MEQRNGRAAWIWTALLLASCGAHRAVGQIGPPTLVPYDGAEAAEHMNVIVKGPPAGAQGEGTAAPPILFTLDGSDPRGDGRGVRSYQQHIELGVGRWKVRAVTDGRSSVGRCKLTSA